MKNIQPGKIALLSNGAYGSKASGLQFMQENNFNVPDFYLVDYDTLLEAGNNESLLLHLLNTWIGEYKIGQNELWAIRSSASVEDGAEHSFAGLFNSEVNVPTSELHASVMKVLSAYRHIPQNEYQATGHFSYGIIIQKMICPDYSGVIFSHNPITGNKEPLVNIIPGLGMELVSGKENSVTIIKSGNKFTFSGVDNICNGVIYKNGLSPISKTLDEMKNDLNPLLNELFQGIGLLCQLKKEPIDVEFTIANSTIYWLQVRPITTIKTGEEEEEVICDNSNIGENYPSLTMPLTISFVQHSYTQVYSSMASFLGMSKSSLHKNSPYLDNLTCGINGRLYYQITNWQRLLYQLPFGKKTSSLITKMMGMDDASFLPSKNKPGVTQYIKLLFRLLYSFFFFKRVKAAFEQSYSGTIHEYGHANFCDKSHEELVKLFRDVETRICATWVAPMINGFFTMMLFFSLKKVFANSRLKDKYPNFINDMMYSQGDIVSVRIVRELQAIINTIRANEDIKRIFSTYPDSEIASILSLKYPLIKQQIDSYISDFGERCNDGEMKIETVNFKEDPASFYKILKASIASEATHKNTIGSFNYAAVIKAQYKYNFLKQRIILYLAKTTIGKVKDRENFRFMRTKTVNIPRRIFRAMDSQLLKTGSIQHPNDSLYLNLDEILDPQKAKQYKDIINKRKADYETFATLPTVSRYVCRNSKYFPVENIKAYEVKSTHKGTGCCSGIVTGNVLIIDDSRDGQSVVPGSILVAKYFEPGNINLFAKAAALVSERGNLLSHTAILSREMGIPAIVGVKNITAFLRTGDKIQLDGLTGEIKILESAGVEQ